jgi:alpha-tubulin suppressor-like RCC1 family protein
VISIRRLGLATLLIASVTGVAVGEGSAATGNSRSASERLSAWGDNSGGELGDGGFRQRSSPSAVSKLKGVEHFSAGYRFNLALLRGGTVKAWGENQFGELGNGTTASGVVPVPVKGLKHVVAVAAGGGHSLALLSDGHVMAWGYNHFGQLGDGTTKNRSTPVRVKGLTGVKAIAAGQLDSVALLDDGTVMTWGDNRDGELGDGTVDDSSVPVAVRGLQGVRAIAAGAMFNVALLGDGTVAAWGNGEQGELGNGFMGSRLAPVAVKGLSGVSAVSAGGEFVLAKLKGGQAMAWGSNAFGQLGDPSAGSGSDVPISIAGLPHVRSLVAGGLSGFAVLSSGHAKSWGSNAFGQLGNGTTTDSSTPLRVPGLSGVKAAALGANHGLALATPVSHASSGPASPWRVVRTPDPGPSIPGITDVFFTGVSAASKHDAWGVGTDQDGLTQVPVSAHWNGSSWHSVPMPAPASAGGSIQGVLDLAPGNAWAVGRATDSTTNVSRTLIEHWDGTSWSIVPSPNPALGPTAQDELEAVDGVSANDIWAVGFDTNPPQPLTLLFEHYDGTKWTAVPPPGLGGQVAFGVTTISSDDAWAVGANESLSRTVAVHWNGKAWSIVKTPSPVDGPSPINQLTGASAAGPKDVWASGYEANVNNLNFRKPYLLHWNGSVWKLVPARNSGTEGSLLRAVTVLSPNDVWAVGQTQQDDGSILSLTEQFNGKKWTRVPSPDPGSNTTLVDDGLGGVASPGHGFVLALGFQERLGICCTSSLGLKTKRG